VVDEDENTVNKRNGQEIIAGRNRPQREEPEIDLEMIAKIRLMKIEMQTVNMF